ncbi:MAG: hypothetical protein IIA85_02320 [Nanoarchaeota archaeon]|nr:hypothetical protein [Nanoarchaeota archaeon]
MELSSLNKITLEEELLEQGFEPRGPVAASELSEEIRLLYSEEIRPTHVNIFQGKIARGDANKYPGIYMIYYSLELEEELLEKSFKGAAGPFNESEIVKEFNKLYSKEEKPIYTSIIQVRGDMGEYSELYMIYFK